MGVFTVILFQCKYLKLPKNGVLSDRSVPYQIKVMMHPGKIASLTNIFSTLSLQMVVYHHTIIAFRASLKVFKRRNLLSGLRIKRQKTVSSYISLR